MFEEIEAMVSGKVQQVMYRDFVQSCAVGLGVVGFVENAEKGTVRVVAQGTPDALKALIDRLNEGSVLSRVANVAVTWRSPSRQFDDFSVRY
jgi:acylphosphatase